MSTARNPRRLADQAGVLPAAFVAALAGVGAPMTALAQPEGDVKISSPDKPITGGQPAGVRDPMKPGQPAAGDKAKVKVSDQMTVDLHVKDESITNVLELLSIQSQKNIIASKSVSGKISADLYNVTFDEALDAILHVNGFGWIQQGNFIYVYTAEELERIRKTLSKRAAKVIRLNYLNAVDAAEFVKPMISQGGEIKTSNKTENFTIPDSSPTGKDDYALGATLVVIDYEENIAAIEKLLVELDTKPAQVLVEATVLQTKLEESNAFGVDFSIIGDLNFNEFAGALKGPLGIVDAIRSGGGASPPASLADNNGVGVVSTPGKTDGPGTLKIGVVSDNISVILKLLDTVGDTALLANPKLLTLNRQPARVLVGQRLGYLSSTATETSTTQTVQFLDTGVQLYFRPFVSASGDIRMELKPQVSSATTTPYTTSAGTVIIPNETTQEVVTNVIVKDGMTIVIGGLFKEEIQATRSQVPFIGDIPIIGTAFKGHDDSTKREEIIFLITPSIVNDNVLLSQGEDARNVIDRVRAGNRQGLLPWSRDRMTAQLNLEAERYYREGDINRAQWTLSRSLSLNPRQPDAIRLREKFTGQRELWPTGATFDGLLSSEFNDRVRTLTPGAAVPEPHKYNPWGSTVVPTQPIRPEPVAPVPSADPSKNRPHLMPSNPMPGTSPMMPAAPTTGQNEAPSADSPTADATPAPTMDAAAADPTGDNLFFGGSDAGAQMQTMQPVSPSAPQGEPGADAGSMNPAASNATSHDPNFGNPAGGEMTPSAAGSEQTPVTNVAAPSADAEKNGFASGKPVDGAAASSPTTNYPMFGNGFVLVPMFHGFWMFPVPSPVATVPTEGK